MSRRKTVHAIDSIPPQTIGDASIRRLEKEIELLHVLLRSANETIEHLSGEVDLLRAPPPRLIPTVVHIPRRVA